ncbi:PREDICTED: uncharacterized protein LOC107104110 [Cyprinodon variegatus]|uniref:uncharacterized protein LOC107104110 n=1 Tax=Cyprinodon variegatus TaxID=28743 RepID=UPI000742667C|nr:PREDICTED: uncharacterized protein LOC107104110 [Cyprinodon variegatus]
MLSAGLGPTESSNMDPKISLSEVQTLIEQEVQKALADKDREVESVIQHLQDTYEETSFEMSIQRLENRINAVARRAEVALSYIAKNQKQSPPSSTDNTNILSESPQHDHVKATPENRKGPTYKTTSGTIIKMMQTARNALKRFHADNEGLTTVLKDSDFERTPPVLTPMKPLKPRVKNEPWGLGLSNVGTFFLFFVRNISTDQTVSTA